MTTAAERHRETSRAWKERNADRVREYSRAYRKANIETRRAKHREWVASHPENVAQHRETHRGKETHKREDRVQYAREWYASPRGRARALINNAMHRARKQDVPFDLTWEWLHERLLAGTCEVTGIPFAFDGEHKRTVAKSPFSPSLDRLDSSKGYTKDNTRVTVWIMNLAKSNFTDADVAKFCAAFVVAQKVPVVGQVCFDLAGLKYQHSPPYVGDLGDEP
jgi:hypothetical protein